ncbi:hypothetical protein Aperf_G00000066798 [Anoplocephala perfoliata]
MSRNQFVGPAGGEMPPIKRLPRFAVSPCTNKKNGKIGRRVYSQPDFQKELEVNASTESLRVSANTPTKMGIPARIPALQSPRATRLRRDGPLSPKIIEHDVNSLGSLTPLRETPSSRRSPQISPTFKTFHAPKANQVYAVPVVRTFDPTRIDALIETLSEKLVCS